MTSIRNSTSAFYERSTQSLTSLRSQAEKLQQQLSTGEKLARSSDNPVAASRLRSLSRSEGLAKIDKANADRATADLTIADNALSSIAGYIGRAKELATQAANGVLTDSQRLGIGEELKQLHNELLQIANTRDSSGHALFGGNVPGDAYTLDAAGNATYIGAGEAAELPIGEGLKIAPTLTGPDFLSFSVGGNPTDLMAVIKTLGDELQAGTGNAANASREALSALNTGLEAITTNQTIIGSRAAWVDLTTTRRMETSELRATERAEIGGIDITSTVADLQQLLLVLDASQASFTKLAGLTLFDQIR